MVVLAVLGPGEKGLWTTLEIMKNMHPHLDRKVVHLLCGLC